MTKQLEAMKMALEWIEDAVVILSHTSTAIQGGIGAEAEGVGGASVSVITALREAIEAAEGYVLVPVEPTEEMLNALGNSWTGVNIATWQRLIAAAQKGGA